MFFLTWLSAIHRHGENRLRGWYALSYALPLICIIIFAVERLLVFYQNDGALSFLSYLSDGRLYHGSLFDVWQMWTYVFYHDGMFHLIINCIWFIPISIYWERHCGIWYVLCLLLLFPFSVVVAVLSPFALADVGMSPIIFAMYGAILIQRRHRHGEYILLTWFGSRLSFRRVVKPLRWAVLAYLTCELLRLSILADLAWSEIGMYAATMATAMCAGASLFTVFDHVQRLCLPEDQQTTT